MSKYALGEKCHVLLSPAFGNFSPQQLAGWILEDRLDVRLNLQLHAYIFGQGKRVYNFTMVKKGPRAL